MKKEYRSCIWGSWDKEMQNNNKEQLIINENATHTINQENNITIHQNNNTNIDMDEYYMEFAFEEVIALFSIQYRQN